MVRGVGELMPDRVWMATAKLRAYARSGRTLDEIATLNEQETGWRPTRSTVSKKLLAMGEEPRHVARRDLVPWDLRPEHSTSRFRLMLQAESRRRAGMPLSNTDRKYVDLLDDLLMGRGTPLVVGYNPEIGFYLADRTEDDRDIIREPESEDADEDETDNAPAENHS
jgi:hypothetical protein